MPNILILEDDISLNNGIVLALKQESYYFYQSFDISTAKKHLYETQFDLIIMDVNLPDGNGFELCKQIRMHSAIPIIMLTVNDLETDVVTGLELGADDYITKPFSLMILRARINALLRRSAQSTSLEKYSVDDFIFDFGKMGFYKGKMKIELSKTEQRLLKILVSNQDIVLARAVLVDKIWTDGAEYVDENALSVTIKRLRDKLEESPSKPKYIKTVYGMGYTWAVKEHE